MHDFLSRYWRSVAASVPVIAFLIFKVVTLNFRMGDPTAYWYMAKVVGQGVLPYRDFFFADPPILVVVLTPLVKILGDHLLILQLIPSIFEAITAVLLAHLLKRMKVLSWWVAPSVYLGSFTILATSDYGTGMQLATLFLVISLHLRQSKYYFWMGVFLALSCLTKLYMGAAVLGLLGWYLSQRNWQAVVRIAAGGTITGSGVLGVFWILSGGALFHDVVLHQFARPAGLNKTTVVSYFIAREWWLLVLGAWMVWRDRQPWWVWLLGAEICFFVLFQDLYYAYFGILLLPLTIALAHVPSVVSSLQYSAETKMRITEMLSILSLAWFALGAGLYAVRIQHEGTFTTIREVTQAVAALPRELPLYGSHELVPLLALQTDRPIFMNSIDTNTQSFASQAQDLILISEQAVTHGVILISVGQLHPTTQQVVSFHEGYFSEQAFAAYCQIQKTIAVSEHEPEKLVVISLCQKR